MCRFELPTDDAEYERERKKRTEGAAWSRRRCFRSNPSGLVSPRLASLCLVSFASPARLDAASASSHRSALFLEFTESNRFVSTVPFVSGSFPESLYLIAHPSSKTTLKVISS